MAKKGIKIDTRKFFLLNLPHFIRYLFTGEVLPMLAIFSFAFIFMPFSTLVYLFLTPIILLMVYKFSFDVLVDTASGNMSPLVRSNYLVTNVIGVKVAIFALLIEGGLWLLKNKGYDESYRQYFLYASAFITPAVYMNLAFTNSMFEALNPINIVKMIAATSISYIVFVGFWLATIMLHEQIINPFIYHNIPVFISGILTSFIEYAFLILNFHIMGYIIFQNRNKIDLEGSGFKRVENDTIEIETEIVNPIYERIKNLLSDDEPEHALAMIMELQNEGDNSMELQGLSKRAIQQKLYSPTNLEIGKKVHNRLKDSKISKAFSLMSDQIDAGSEFLEASASDIKTLIEHAIQVNKPQYVAPLVKSFHEKYLYHEDIVPNYFLYAKVLYNDKATRDQSKILLQGLINKYPQDKAINEVKSWLQGIELMNKK